MSSNFFVIIDYGSHQIRMKIYDEKDKEIFSISSETLSYKLINEQSEIINMLIRKAEKKISSHITNALVIYDDPDIFNVDLSLKKKFDKSVDIKKYLPNILQEAQSLVYSNYKDVVILHSINQMILVDGEKHIKFENKDLSGNNLVLSYKFLCLPKKKYFNVENNFKKNNLNILSLYCSTFLKSLNHKQIFKNNYLTFCLDVGWEKSTLICLENEYINFIGNIRLGGNHFTKDISKIMQIDLLNAEKIKISFSSQNFNEETNSLVIKKQNFLKQIIIARMNEIINLSFNKLDFLKKPSISKINLLLTGNGSKVFNKLLNDIKTDFEISVIKTLDQYSLNEFYTGMKLYFHNNKDNLNNLEKMSKKKGFFEKFFNFFQ